MGTKITIENGEKADNPEFKPLNLVCLHEARDLLVVQCVRLAGNTPSLFSGIVIRGNDSHTEGYFSDGWAKSSFKTWPGKVILESTL